MSLSEEWKKKKENSLSEQWKKRKQKESEELIESPETKIASYDSLKKSTLKEIGTQIKNENEERKQQENLTTYNNENTSNNKSLLSKASYIGKNLNNGILSGTAGIAQSGLTDIANQMEKGSQKDIWSILGDSANALIGIINPIQGINNTINKIPERISNTFSTLTDKNKNAVEKITSIGLDATNAPIEDNQYKNLLDIGSQVVGKINPNASNEILNINNKISEPIQEQQQKLAEKADEYDKVTQTLGGVAQVIGNMAPSIAVSALTRNPNAGLATMAMSAKGQSTQEALNKGAELDEAIKIGNTKAMIEVGTEMLTGGVNIFGKGALDDIVQRGIVDKVKNNIAKKLVQQGVNISGEVLEETISDILDTTIDKGTIDPNTSYSINDWKDTALTTMLSTVVLNAITGGLGNVQNLKNNSIDLQQNQVNNENNIQTQQTMQEQNKMFKNQTLEQINNNLANNQETLYNNNESESGINGEQGRSTNGIQTSNLGGQEENAFSVDRYKQEETKIRSQGEVKYTDNDKNFATKMQNKYNKKIFIYDDTNTSYGGGISYIDNDTIMFGRNALDNYGYDFLEGHEVLEDINKNYKDIAKKTLDNLKQKLQDDTGFGDVFLKYIADMKDDVYQYYINKPELIAKEIIGDLNGLRNANIDYSTLENYKALNPELVKEIQNEVSNLENIIYSNKGNENSNESSFSFPKVEEKSQKINFPTDEDIKKIENKESNVYKYNKNKQNIIKANEKAINNLISNKNETLNSLDMQIFEKEKILKNKVNKDTKLVANIRNQIERLKVRKIEIEKLYNEKIDKFYSKNTLEKVELETRNMMKQEARNTLRAEIEPLVKDLTQYKDKKAGILYNRETAQRNIDDIVKDKELATAIKEIVFDPIQVHQAEKTREINHLFKKINDLNIDKEKKYYFVPKNEIVGIKIDEATLAQLIIEKEITDIDLRNYQISNDNINKIHKIADTFTEILDYLYDKMNEQQIKYGYSPIGKIKDYFPHFFENKPDTMLGKVASYFGVDLSNQNLPTEIAGKTDIFKPGRTWDSNIQKRRTNKTDYDALTAMEKYIYGAADLIYTTEDIQRVREYSKQIRYKFSDKGIQKEIDSILNDNTKTQEMKDAELDGLFKNTENELSNFVTWLDDYANILANKKSFSDRNMERNIGRNIYSSMSGIESRIAANTIGGNLSVSITNFAPIFQAAGTTKPSYLLTGMLQTVSNDIREMTKGNKDISFINNSNFLTNRFGTDTISDKKLIQKISDIASIPMNKIDEFTSESIVRAKYLENIDRGMTEEVALDNADKYAAKIMADRSKGALPVIFNTKNPISKLITMFQVEPNNMISNYLKDMPRDAKNKTQLIGQATRLMVASYAFNTIAMAVRGGNEVLPDPIRWVSYLIKAITGDDDEKEKAKTDLTESIVGMIPFLSNLAGFVGIEDIGRVPISNAMPDVTNLTKVFNKDADSTYKKEIAWKEISKPLLYLGLPVGGAQLKKTIEGTATVKNGGSYKTNSEGEEELQFPIENANLLDYLKAGAFGKYALSDSKYYAERSYKSLNAKQTKMYKEANIPYKELLDYIDKKFKKKEEKIAYLETQDLNEQQKWGIYKYDILSNTERDDGGSQLSDAEYMISNGLSKNEFINIYNKAQKNNIDIPTETEYKKMKKSGINLNNYIDYKIEVKNQTQAKRDSGELTKKQDLKDKDKIQILLDSKYSDKEITAIYENYIKNAKDTQYDIISKSGIDIKEYLKYKQQEFESDKKDDGTTTGKTISGSKKKKEYSYVNSMNITYEQKLLLLGMNYTLTNKEQTKLANYVNNMKLTKQEKLDIYEKLSGFTVYKNGRVTW